MQKPKNQKLKTYTALALALSLTSPISAFATEGNIKADDTPTSASDSILALENEQTKPYYINITPVLDETSTKITYDIKLTKNSEEKANLTAQIFLPEKSNLKDIKVISDNELKEIKTTEDNRYIEFNLGEDNTSLKLEANIKENTTDNLFFDLSLVDTNLKFVHADRISHSIKQEDDTKTLEKNQKNELVSNISGKFISKDEIKWSGYLINPTDKVLNDVYNLEISDTQSFDGAEITLENYSLDNDGKLVLKEEKSNLSNINYTIPSHNFVIFSFQTKAKEDASEFTLNDVRLTREIENKEPEISKEETEPEESKENTTDTSKLEEPTAKDVEEMIEDLKEGSDQIVDALEEADVDLIDELKTSSYDGNENQQKDESNNTKADEKIKADLAKEEDKETKENQKTEPTKESDKDNKKDIEDKKEAEKTDQTPAQNSNEQVDFDKLTKEINDTNKEIVDLLKENGIVSPIVVETQNIFTTNTNQATTDIEKLTKEILDATVEIEKLARQIYGDEAYDSVIKKQSQAKDTNLDKLIADITQTNTEIESTLLEAFKEEKDTYTDQEVKELIQILNKLSELKENTSKAIEKEDKKDLANSLNKTPVLGEDKTKDIKDVKTVTLDPLDQATINDITKDITNPIFKNKVLKIIREAGL